MEGQEFYCPKCNHSLVNRESFCPNCGQKIIYTDSVEYQEALKAYQNSGWAKTGKFLEKTGNTMNNAGNSMQKTGENMTSGCTAPFVILIIIVILAMILF
ncbi:zinc-ribbon domain-containing protein [Enterococcus sp. BWM-S5]|uniref:Zinc-ribbon domain-containing protein n=1 Tax=Enterococcus larvae TaxID=2794352 RepID=A0ABS4CGA8_9ENTE|nr:zinc-ribbon domain-containing protein [Enterococcus larvae]MBP1044889.1 zinc-ribbon domain-containing protein [Enterococcus larvae]